VGQSIQGSTRNSHSLEGDVVDLHIAVVDDYDKAEDKGTIVSAGCYHIGSSACTNCSLDSDHCFSLVYYFEKAHLSTHRIWSISFVSAYPLNPFRSFSYAFLPSVSTACLNPFAASSP